MTPRYYLIYSIEFPVVKLVLDHFGYALTGHPQGDAPTDRLLIRKDPQAAIGIFAETSRFEMIVFD